MVTKNIVFVIRSVQKSNGTQKLAQKRGESFPIEIKDQKRHNPVLFSVFFGSRYQWRRNCNKKILRFPHFFKSVSMEKELLQTFSQIMQFFCILFLFAEH
jgi:hypothetical protein